METKQEVKATKSNPQSLTSPIRVKRETRKRILAELAKLNKKDFGRRIRMDDLISLALSLITSEHRQQLQDASLSNADKMERMFREYAKANPGVSRDQFIGTLLTGNGSDVKLATSIKVAE